MGKPTYPALVEWQAQRVTADLAASTAISTMHVTWTGCYVLHNVQLILASEIFNRDGTALVLNGLQLLVGCGSSDRQHSEAVLINSDATLYARLSVIPSVT